MRILTCKDSSGVTVVSESKVLSDGQALYSFLCYGTESGWVERRRRSKEREDLCHRAFSPQGRNVQGFIVLHTHLTAIR